MFKIVSFIDINPEVIRSRLSRHYELETEVVRVHGLAEDAIANEVEDADILLGEWTHPAKSPITSKIIMDAKKAKLVRQPTVGYDNVDHLACKEAGIDVFESEPASKDNPLLGLDNVIVTPHAAGTTLESSPRYFRIALDNIAQVLKGGCPFNVVNL